MLNKIIENLKTQQAAYQHTVHDQLILGAGNLDPVLTVQVNGDFRTKRDGSVQRFQVVSFRLNDQPISELAAEMLVRAYHRP